MLFAPPDIGLRSHLANAGCRDILRNMSVPTHTEAAWSSHFRLVTSRCASKPLRWHPAFFRSKPKPTNQ
jgi:hypothetical protein